MALPCTSYLHAAHQQWRDLYLRALFETDKRIASRLILEAEKTIVQRERELFFNAYDPAERDALNTALHALEALKSCMEVSAVNLAA